MNRAMSRAGAVVDLDCNVDIKVIDKYRRVVRSTTIHNKATVNMIDGILRFMKGDFTKTSYSDSLAPEDGSPYLPSQIRFGRIGVKVKEDATDKKPHFDYINEGEFIQTVFSTTSLQEPCLSKFDEKDESEVPIFSYFDKIRQTGYSDSNNAECLEFSVYITPGTLVGKTLQPSPDDPNQTPTFKPYHYAYWNPNIGEYEAMITEIALTSGYGTLLARVLLDGKVSAKECIDSEGKSLGMYPVPEDPDGEYTPITQSQSSTVVITWRLGIVSVGRDDEILTPTDLTSLCRELAGALLNDYNITQTIDGVERSVPLDSLAKNIESKIQKVLDGESII